MSAEVGRVGRGFAVLGTAEVGARVIGFLVTVFVSHQIGPSGFGVISFALAALLYANRLASWELEAVGVREVAQRDKEGQRLAGSLLWGRLASAVVVAAIIAAVAPWWLPREDAHVLSLYGVGLCCVAMNGRFIYLMRQEPSRPAVARLITEATAATILLATVRGAEDLLWVPAAYIGGEAAGALALWLGLRRDGPLWSARIDRSFVGRTARAAWPLVLSSLLGLLAFNLDLILLRFTYGAETAGYYGAAYALVSLILNLGVTFYANVLPALSRARDDRGAFITLHADASVLVVTLFLPVVVGGALLAGPLVHLVFGETYARAAAPLGLLFVSTGLTVFRFVPLATVVADGDRRRALWINGIGAAVSAVLVVALIPRFGLMGAAVSTVVTDTIRLAVALTLCARLGVPFGYLKRHWRAGVAAGAMALVVWLLRESSLFVTVPVGGLTYAVALVIVGGLRFGESLRPRLAS